MSVSPDSGAKTLDGSLFYDEGLHGRANRAPTPHEVPHFGIGSSIKQQQGQSPLDPQWEDETPSIRKIPVISIPSATLGSPRQYPPPLEPYHTPPLCRLIVLILQMDQHFDRWSKTAINTY